MDTGVDICDVPRSGEKLFCDMSIGSWMDPLLSPMPSLCANARSTSLKSRKLKSSSVAAGAGDHECCWCSGFMLSADAIAMTDAPHRTGW